MADSNSTKKVLSVIATNSERVKELPIADGQLIFVQDKGRIAFDFKRTRKFYNQITELETERERVSMDVPAYGYYFVIETCVLWYYSTEWVQLTSKPNYEDIVFIGVEFPQLGQEQTIYVNKKDGDEHISIWDQDSNDYRVVANRTYSVTSEEVTALFN